VVGAYCKRGDRQLELGCTRVTTVRAIMSRIAGCGTLPKDLTGKYQSPVSSLQPCVASRYSSLIWQAFSVRPWSLHDWMERNCLPVKVIVSMT